MIVKPPGMTSFDVVRQVRRSIGVRKVGHAGTLDPAATGLLILLTGRATRWQSEFMNLEKEYRATILLGVVTNTLDLESEVTERKNVPEIAKNEVSSLLADHFSGEIEQVPPAFSALKRGGVPSYRRARRGEQVTLNPRKVTVHAIDLEAFLLPEITVRLRCSSGFYVRSLARDIGQAIGCGGTLKSLVRTRIGPYHLDDAMSLDELVEELSISSEPVIPSGDKSCSTGAGLD